MTKNQLEEIVRQARGLDPQQEINPEEEWDSLDHLSVLATLSQEEDGIPEGLDASNLNSFSKLSAALCK